MKKSSDSVMEFEQNSASSLVEICSTMCLRDLSTFCDADCNGTFFKLKDNVTLPKEICEHLLRMYAELTDKVLDDEFINIFHDTLNTRLERVCIRNSMISDKGLNTLFRHKITDLDIEGCHQLTHLSLQVINSKAEHLIKLNFGSLSNIFAISDDSPVVRDCAVEEDSVCNPPNSVQQSILRTPNLKYLKLNSLRAPFGSSYFTSLLNPLKSLVYLDISDCVNLGALEGICSMPYLTSLILYNVLEVELIIPSICKVKTLRYNSPFLRFFFHRHSN